MSKLTLRDLHEQLAEVLGLEGIPFNIEKDIEDFVKQGWTGQEILQTVKYDQEIRKVKRDLKTYGITWAKFVKDDALAFYAKKAAREAEANKPNPAIERWRAARLSGKYDITCNAPRRRTRSVRLQEIDLSKTN